MTTTYLLDTNIISHMMRETTGIAAQAFAAIARNDATHAVQTSIVVLCELRFGLLRKPNQRLDDALARILTGIEVLPLDHQVVAHYASLRTHLEAQGQAIGPNDTFIAAHALAVGATLVTADAEFNRVPSLRVENWLAADPQPSLIEK